MSPINYYNELINIGSRIYKTAEHKAIMWAELKVIEFEEAGVHITDTQLREFANSRYQELLAMGEETEQDVSELPIRTYQEIIESIDSYLANRDIVRTDDFNFDFENQDESDEQEQDLDERTLGYIERESDEPEQRYGLEGQLLDEVFEYVNPTSEEVDGSDEEEESEGVEEANHPDGSNNNSPAQPVPDVRIQRRGSRTSVGNLPEESTEWGQRVSRYLENNAKMISYFSVMPRIAPRTEEERTRVNYAICIGYSGNQQGFNDALEVADTLEDALQRVESLGYRYSQEWNIFIKENGEHLEFARIFMDMDFRNVMN